MINTDKSGANTEAIETYNKICFTKITIREQVLEYKYLNNREEQGQRLINSRMQSKWGLRMLNHHHKRAPEIIKYTGYITLKCATEGASIGYKINSGKQANNKCNWIVYTGEKIPVQKGDSIIVRAQRIGYIASEATIDF